MLVGRFRELSDRAQNRDCYAYSEFLTLAEQSLLRSVRYESEVILYGGAATAERQIACFKGMDCCYDEDPPVVCISISPLVQKFADELTHRDFLGSLIGLGIRREVLGDIIVYENCGYLFCLESISDFICSELKKVRHTDVECKVIDAPPAASVVLPEISRIVISSERLDAVISAVFKLSRNDSQKLFGLGRVFVNGKERENFTDSPKTGDIISVRGIGRFIYEGIDAETRKGRLGVSVRIYRR